VSDGGFQWGWDALVAIGTIALALGTLLLAWSTRSTAKASSEEVRAQWRPALVPGQDVEAHVDSASELMAVAVRNVGRGAAYYVDAALGIGDSYLPARPSSPLLPVVQNFAVLPVDGELELYFEIGDDRVEKAELLIDYADLNGRPYSTRVAVDKMNVDLHLRMSKVKLFDNRERIPWKPWTWEPETRLEWLATKLRRLARRDPWSRERDQP
jgi:hypothetical protein